MSNLTIVLSKKAIENSDLILGFPLEAWFIVVVLFLGIAIGRFLD